MIESGYMHPFDAILFDLGGTLIHFQGHWPEVVAQSDGVLIRELNRAGFQVGEDFLLEYRARLDAYYEEREAEFVEVTTLYLLQQLLTEYGFQGLQEADLRPALDAAYAVSQAHWQPEPDALYTLQTLSSQGYLLGLISNAADDQDVQILVDKIGARPYLDAIQTSAATGIRKPNPDIFLEVLAKWGLPAKRAAMVGDTLGADVLGAQNAGMYSIWITRRAVTPANSAHQETIHPDAKISTLMELLELLERLQREDEVP